MAELVAAPRSSLVDPAVRQKLRIHQLQACDFVLDRLFPEAFSVQPSTLEQNPFVVPQTGAIIADDVGTGKTFVALSIIFTLCKSKSCKAVVVCPTSLIGNWEKEAKQWFPGSLGRTHLCICSSSGQSQKTMDLLVNRFVTSHPTVHPMLIIGYEMFRTYSEALNAINSLELLVCDEGHRLKNIMGTQTSLALANCVAQRRLVLTGTVLQNNLDELFAVVQFVIPDYLGTIKEFRREYADPIMKSKAAEATAEQKRKVGFAVFYQILQLMWRLLVYPFNCGFKIEP